MITKEQCEQALDHFEKCYWDQDNSYSAMNGVRKDLDILNKLIHEHFDNPPLKFEEIKENDFIFDKKTKERAKVRETRNTDGEKYIIFFQGYRCWDFYIKKYEPNRFYRKEV